MPSLPQGGIVVFSTRYGAFSNLQGTPSLETNYLYRGQQFDPISELYSLRARYYDASIGRFLSRDTWAYDFGNPVELNRYVYAANNPATWSDPSGYMLNIGGYSLSASLKPVVYTFGVGLALGIGYAVWLLMDVIDFPEIEEWSPPAKEIDHAPPHTGGGSGGDNGNNGNGNNGWDITKVGAAIGTLIGTGTALCALLCPLLKHEPQPQPTQQAVTQTPTALPTATPTPSRRLHISLGLNESSRILDDNGGKIPLLFLFTLRLNMRFNSQGIYVYDYGDWVTQRLATNQGLYITEYFDLAFREVADNAERIHYNLEGIRGNPVTFADTQGNQGRFAGTPNWAATELYIIRTEGYCNKTTFWQNGSTSPTPDRTAWQQICS